MNGYGLAAVIVVCVTALLITLLWALVRVGQWQVPRSGSGPVRMPDSERMRLGVRAAVERAVREGRGAW